MVIERPLFSLKFFLFLLLLVPASTVCAQVHADFNANQLTGCAPQVIHFTDLSTGGPVSWHWDFGNGLTSTQQNPSGFYASPGSYTVKLRVNNAQGTDSIVKSYYILIFANPIADFITADTVICAPGAVNFTNLSQGVSSTIQSWFWNFGDGGTSTLPNPVHVYATAGVFTVILDVYDVNGCHGVRMKNNFIRAHKPDASFSYSLAPVCEIPVLVNFHNQSTGDSLIYNWSFGDGNTSTLPNPDNTYTLQNTYHVKLIAKDSLGCMDTAQTNVLIPDFHANFSYTVSCNADSPPVFTLTDESNVTPAQWLWVFRSSEVDYAQNPVYAAPVFDTVYTIMFTATLSNGCSDTISKTYFYPKADFPPVLHSCQPPYDISFSNNSIGQTPLTYVWNFGDLGTSTLPTPTHTFTYSPPYMNNVMLVARDTNGCRDTTFNLVTLSHIDTYLSETPDIQCAPLVANFSDSSFTNYTFGSWYINYGDPASGVDSSSFNSNSFHIYWNPGNYHVTYTVTLLDGCMDTTSRNIHVGVEPDSLDVLFSPNDSICFGSILNVTALSYFPDTSIHASHWEWLFGYRSDMASLDNFCHDTLYNDPTNYFACARSANHLYNDIRSTCGITPVSFGGDSWWPQRFTATTGNDTVRLRADFYGCSKYITKPIYINPTVAKPGFLLHDNCLLSACSAPYSFGVYNHSISCDTLYSFNLFNAADNSIIQNFTDPTDTVIVNINRAGSYGIHISGHNNTDGCTNTRDQYFVVDSMIGGYKTNPRTACLNGNAIGFSDTSHSTYGSLGFIMWDFGDGNWIATGDTSSFLGSTSRTADIDILHDNGATTTGTYAHPVHTYLDTGTYYTRMITTADLPISVAGGTYYRHCPHYFNDSVRIVGLRMAFTVSDSLICPNNSVNFSNTSASSVAITSWSWNFGDGSALSNNQSPSYTYPFAGLFTVMLTAIDANLCTDSLTIPDMVTVTIPIPSFTVSDSIVCKEIATEFINNSSPAGSTYLWKFGDGLTSTNDNPSYIYNTSGYFSPRLIVTDPYGCVDSITKNNFVRILLPPEAGFTADGASAGCPPFLVQFHDTTIIHSVVSGWQWNFGDANYSSLQNPSHMFTTAGNFDIRLVVTDVGGCSDTAYYNQTINIQGPNGSFSFDPDTSCGPINVTFVRNSVNNDYIFWDFGDGQVSYLPSESIADTLHHEYLHPGIYSPKLILQDSSGCSFNTINFNSIYLDSLVAKFNFGDSIKCSMNAITFNNHTVSYFPVKYHWSFGTSDSSSIAEPTYKYKRQGTYLVDLLTVSEIGCTSEIHKNITVYPQPNVVLNVTDTSGCAPFSVYFAANDLADSVAAVNRWFWNFGDSITGEGKGLFHTFSDSGHFTIVSKASYGDGACTLNTTAHTTAYLVPKAAFSYTPPFPVENISRVTFSDSSSHATQWLWNFGTGDYSDVQHPEYDFHLNGTFTVREIVSNAGVCYDTTEKRIFIAPHVFAKIPNAFTPNGDGNNDLLKIYYAGILELVEFNIYNRWGEKVFHTQNIEDGWDGTFQGKPERPGTYYYYFLAKTLDSAEPVLTKGSFNLIR